MQCDLDAMGSGRRAADFCGTAHKMPHANKKTAWLVTFIS